MGTCYPLSRTVSGIFGAWHFDGRPVERQLLKTMSDTLAPRGPREGFTLTGPVGMGCRLPGGSPDAIGETQPVARPSGTCLVFDGRLDNRDDLIRDLRDAHDVSPGTADADIVAAAYDAFGLAFAARLLGDFSLALFDPREQRMVLARDAIGIRPLYYRHTPASLTFGSEIKTLLAVPGVEGRPNDRLLGELLLRHLHRHDDDGSTLFEGINGVPPSHLVILSRQQSVLRRYWDFDGRPASGGQSFDECAEGFRYHFSRSVDRRLRSAHPVAVAVSGGLDSSSIFCTASRGPGAVPLLGLTYATHSEPSSDDSRFVRVLEQSCGRPIEPVERPASEGLLFRSDELIDRVEAPMMNAQWFHGERLLLAARARGARTLLSGHWGDQVLFDQAYLVDLFHAGSWRTIGSHLQAYPEWFDGGTRREFTRGFLADLLEYDLPHWARRGLRGARRPWMTRPPWDDWFSERFQQEPGPDVFDRPLTEGTVLARALYREVRSRYHGLCLEWNNKTAAAHGVDRAFPFLDRDLLEFVMGVPGAVLARDGVPKALMREALKDLVPVQILQRRSKGDFTASVNEASRRDYAPVLRLLGPDALVVQMDYVDADKLLRGLRALEGMLQGSASCVPSWRLAGLVALELWLRRFVGTNDNHARDGRLHEQAAPAQ